MVGDRNERRPGLFAAKSGPVPVAGQRHEGGFLGSSAHDRMGPPSVMYD